MTVQQTETQLRVVMPTEEEEEEEEIHLHSIQTAFCFLTASDTIQDNPIRQTTSFPSKAEPVKKSFILNLRISVCLSFRLVLKYCQYDAGARSRTLLVQKGKGGGGGEGRRTKKNRAVPDKQGIFREELKSTHLMK
jgi:hypothetical protein